MPQPFIKFNHNAMPLSADIGGQTQDTTARSITSTPVQKLSLKSSCFVFKMFRKLIFTHCFPRMTNFSVVTVG